MCIRKRKFLVFCKLDVGMDRYVGKSIFPKDKWRKNLISNSKKTCVKFTRCAEKTILLRKLGHILDYMAASGKYRTVFEEVSHMKPIQSLCSVMGNRM